MTARRAAVKGLFPQLDVPDLQPRYNVAPTQPVLCVRVTEGGGQEPARLRWGLVPAWAESPSIGSRMINARAETVGEKPAFRSAFRKRRCLILAYALTGRQIGSRDGGDSPC
jgi:putative SOS response-associated peptidase YedK